VQQLAANGQALRRAWDVSLQVFTSMQHCSVLTSAVGHAVGGSVQQLAVNDQALRRAWESMSMQQSKPHVSPLISAVCHAVGGSVQQLAVIVQALRRAWESSLQVFTSMQHLRTAHLSADMRLYYSLPYQMEIPVCHAVGSSVQQLAVNNQALEHQAKAGIAANSFSCQSNSAQC